MEYLYRHRDWSNVEVLGRNAFRSDRFTAVIRTGNQRERKERGERKFRLLNGQWKFAYYESPFYVPEECVEETYDDREFAFIPVPGHWQLNGCDFPHYNDAIALFPSWMTRGYRRTTPQASTAIPFVKRSRRTGNISCGLTVWRALTMYGSTAFL